MKDKTHLSALIATAKRPARSVELCLRGDLVADIEDATRTLALVQEFKDKERIEEVSAQILAMKEEMAESVITVRFEALKRSKWLDMLAEHPPAPGREPDESLGFNPETMYPAMIKSSWVSPEVPNSEVSELLDGLNDGQFSELAEAAFAVNTRGAVVPFGWRGYKRAES